MSTVRSALVLMCRRVLYPLVRILLRNGVGAGEMKAIVDSVYTRAGSEYLVEQGERVTYSKLSVITGINRAFLPAMVNAQEKMCLPRSDAQVHRAVRVLEGWFEDPQFYAARGIPAVLRIEGGKRSFRDLVGLYSGGVYYRTMLSELQRIGAVRIVKGDHVRVIKRTLVAPGTSTEHLLSTSETAGDLLSTLEHNLTASEKEQLPVRVVISAASQSASTLFAALVGRHADLFMGDLENLLRSHAFKEARTGEIQSEIVGAAIVTICHKTSDMDRMKVGEKKRLSKPVGRIQLRK